MLEDVKTRAGETCRRSIFWVLHGSSPPPSRHHLLFNLLRHVCCHFAATVQKDSISWSAGVGFHEPGTQRRVWSRRRESGRRLSAGSDPLFTFSCLTTIKIRLHRTRLQGRKSEREPGNQGTLVFWFSACLPTSRRSSVRQAGGASGREPQFGNIRLRRLS